MDIDAKMPKMPKMPKMSVSAIITFIVFVSLSTLPFLYFTVLIFLNRLYCKTRHSRPSRVHNNRHNRNQDHYRQSHVPETPGARAVRYVSVSETSPQQNSFHQAARFGALAAHDIHGSPGLPGDGSSEQFKEQRPQRVDRLMELLPILVPSSSVAENQCPVCLDPFVRSPVTMGTCMHPVHKACLSTWLETSAQDTCPLCLTRLLSHTSPWFPSDFLIVSLFYVWSQLDVILIIKNRVAPVFASKRQANWHAN